MSGQGDSRGRRRYRDTVLSPSQKVAARRRRAPGELYVAQTADLAGVEAILAGVGESAGIIAGGLDAAGACWIAASLGETIVGVIGIETVVDAAVIRSLARSE